MVVDQLSMHPARESDSSFELGMLLAKHTLAIKSNMNTIL